MAVPSKHPTPNLATITDAERDELHAHVTGERERISRLSRIYELVLGYQDGLLVPLGVVTGAAGAQLHTQGIVTVGLAEMFAGALSMGTGAYLASQAQNQVSLHEIDAERQEIAWDTELEQYELELLLQDEGLTPEDAHIAVQALATSPTALLKTKVEKELGLAWEGHESEVGDAVVTGSAYAVAALIPLWPYLIFSVHTALPISLIVTAFALFGLGLLKGRVTQLSLMRSGIEVLVVGGISAGLGYGIGRLVPHLF